MPSHGESSELICQAASSYWASSYCKSRRSLRRFCASSVAKALRDLEQKEHRRSAKLFSESAKGQLLTLSALSPTSAKCQEETFAAQAVRAALLNVETDCRTHPDVPIKECSGFLPSSADRIH